MRDLNEHTITQAVLDRFAGTPDPRLKAVMTSLVRHLHNFVRDVEPTFDEWQHVINYLTRTGQMCSGTRQEFILLSDMLGVSMLVDAINHRMPEGATETTVLGPFHVVDVPFLPLGADIGAGLAGERLYRRGVGVLRRRRPAARRRAGGVAVRQRRLLRRAAAGAGGAVAAHPAACGRAGPVPLLDHHADRLPDP